MSDGADGTPGPPAVEPPPPGSDAARAAGCLCPAVDNGRGRGYKGVPGLFVMTAGCPVHGQARDSG